MIRALFVLLVCAGTAVAKPRTAVIGDAKIAAAVREGIADQVELVEVDTATKTAPAALATEHQLAAVIVISTPSGRAVAVVHQGSDGAALGRHDIKGPKIALPKRMRTELWKKLGAKIRAAKAPTSTPPVATKAASAPAIAAGSATPPSTSSTSSTVLETSATPRSPRTERSIVLGVEERPFWRRLRYRDDIDQRLRPSDLVANAIAISTSWRPLRAAPGLALVARGERAVGVNGSRTTDGMEFGTTSSEWAAGLGYDLRLGSVRAGLAAAYGEHRFQVDDEAMPEELVPDVAYKYLRAGFTVDYPLAARWDLAVTAGYRYLRSMGDLTAAAWFPRADGAGIDASVGLGFRATPWLTIHARLDMRRYFFAMNPEIGDPWIAGGAVDQYVGGAIGASISPR